MGDRSAILGKLREARAGLERDGGAAFDPVEDFGKFVFTEDRMRQYLTKSAYKAYLKTRTDRTPLDSDVADQLATAIKTWAVENGATHYTHQFQPLTGKTAEKHDTFLEPTDGGKAIFEFSGKLLLQGEPDASSFPNGGIRQTHEARGYTAMDTSSLCFLRPSVNGKTLIIPTAFVSWTGESLCHKSTLLRSVDVLSKAAVELLHLLGHKDVKHVETSLGAEQEYFLIDRGYYLSRPDLVQCGRTLFGQAVHRGQQLEDHYFGTIPSRVLAYMQDTEHELWRLGLPVKTRHNEVAPSQYETAPVFETASIACDHNNLEMDVMSEIAAKHGLAILFHEKPFANVNGSGKHNNWSMCTNTGLNLLEPTPKSGGSIASNKPFVAALAACIRAVDLHPDVMRSSIAVHGNDFRLGANEAPPAIMSVFLGTHLDEVVQSLMSGVDPKASANGHQHASTLDMKATAIPVLQRDPTDRNRTSPFAFTGNKFEFRAVGSSQNCCVTIMALNAMVAESLTYLTQQIEARMKADKDLDKAFYAVIAETLKKHYRVVFNGNGYSEEWVKEAATRGLKNLPKAPDALELLVSEKNVKLFEGVMSERELDCRKHVLIENYNLQAEIEATVAVDIARTKILPAVQAHQTAQAASMAALGAAGVKSSAQAACLNDYVSTVDALIVATNDLERLVKEAKGIEDSLAAAKFWGYEVGPAMLAVRAPADKLEGLTNNQLWQLPRYEEMLLLK